MVVANFQSFHLSRHPAHRTTKIAIQFLLLISSEIHFPYILWKRGSDFLNEKGVALYTIQSVRGDHWIPRGPRCPGGNSSFFLPYRIFLCFKRLEKCFTLQIVPFMIFWYLNNSEKM